jgi:hypothetical protein
VPTDAPPKSALARRRRAFARAMASACPWRTALGLLAVMLLAAAPARADLFYDASAGAFHDDNLTRAQQSSDIRADGAATLAATAGWFHAVSGADGITLAANANSEAYARFHGLDVVSAGAGAAWRHKFGLGYAAPWASLAVDATHDDYRDEIRDGNRFAARVEFGRRFTETFDASVGVAYDRRIAKNDEPVVPGISGRVFSVRGQSAFARAAYDVTDRLQLGARLTVRRGDVVSTTRRNLEIFEASDAIAADPTFGDDFFAYRLRGTTRSASANLSWALSERASLNLSYAGARTLAYDGLDYRNNVGTFLLAFRF